MEPYIIIPILMGIAIIITSILIYFGSYRKEKEKNETFNYDLSLSEYAHGKIIAIWVKYEGTDLIEYQSSGFGFMQNGIGFYSGPGTEYKKIKCEDTRLFGLKDIIKIVDEDSFVEEVKSIHVDSLTIERLGSQKYNIELIAHYKEKEYAEKYCLDDVLKLHIEFKDGYVQKIDNEEDL